MPISSKNGTGTAKRAGVNGIRTVREELAAISAGPPPDSVLDEAFDDDSSFPAHTRQVDRVVSGLRYLQLIDIGAPDGAAALLTEAGIDANDALLQVGNIDYGELQIRAARQLQARTSRELPDLIGAGELLLERLREARGQWESARQELLRDLRCGTRRAIGRPCDQVGVPTPGSIPRDIATLVWHAPVTLTDDGRIVAERSEDATRPVEWGFCEVRIMAGALTAAAGGDPPVAIALPPPEPKRAAPRLSSEAQIHTKITEVYDFAEEHKMKPPNLAEIVHPVQKLLSREGVKATLSQIQTLAEDERHKKRRGPIGVRQHGRFRPFSDIEI